MIVSNEEFLRVVFRDDAPWAHVTAFPDDPSNISTSRRFRCWSGDYYSRTSLPPGTNQYFTISTFYADDSNRARRRKALFRCTHVIVADDVREKLPLDEVMRLPAPTYQLETSAGSEQWGWVLDVPCQDRHRVENLLDGLVAKGLAPDGKDPGMKGVTRYVRLPQGVNTKSSRLIGGRPFDCRMLAWSPDVVVSLEDLAAPFGVDLDADRRETRVDGAAAVDDHPLLDLDDVIVIKSVRSDGRFDITCPWVSEHTGEADDGAAVFTNGDGSIGFKCHHGSCQHRTGGDLLRLIEETHPGFKARLEHYKMMRVFGDAVAPAAMDFMGAASCAPDAPLDFMGAASCVTETQVVSYQSLIDVLRRTPYTDPASIQLAHNILRAVDGLDHANRLVWWDQVRDHMHWSKASLITIINEQRKIWYEKTSTNGESEMFDGFVYVAEQNAFYSREKRLWLTPEAYQNSHGHINAEARSEALMNGKVQKVDRLDYAPGMPDIFVEEGVRYGNTWGGPVDQGVPGDVRKWLEHFDHLGWSEHKKHMLQWMAFTLRHPERKINHILLLGGGEGTGKDFILYPLIQAMRNDTTTIDGDELLRDFNDFLLGVKYLHINETELGDRREARTVANRTKPLASCPPYRLRVNVKGLRPILIRNLVNCTMTSNSVMPLCLSGDSRRYYAVWTDLKIRGANGQVTPEWQAYWTDRWRWIRDEQGWQACVNYLMTCVDLSDFDPGAVPMVTGFMEDIQEASQDPLTAVIREFIDRKMSLFASDLLMSTDIVRALKLAPMLGYDIKTPTPQVAGKVIKQTGLGISMRVWRHGRDRRVWVIRDHNKYISMEPGEVYDAYDAQMAACRAATPLQPVRVEGGVK